MPNDCEDITIAEGSASEACGGQLYIVNTEVGVDFAKAKVGAFEQTSRRYDLKIGESIVYDAGAAGKYRLILLEVHDGSKPDKPDAATFRIIEVFG
jgi:hypothetical protein